MGAAGADRPLRFYPKEVQALTVFENTTRRQFHPAGILALGVSYRKHLGMKGRGQSTGAVTKQETNDLSQDSPNETCQRQVTQHQVRVFGELVFLCV